MSRIIILANLFAIFSNSITTDSSCGDWTSYQDEKCFKVFDTLTPFSGAEQVCQKEGATIGIIRSAEEQGLVVKNLKNQSIVDNVWIGIKKNGKSFVSLDGKALKYTNWANGRPLNQKDVDCVEITVDDQNKWWDTKCEKKIAVLCEKDQQWSNSKIESVLQQIRQNYSERMDLLEKNFEDRRKEIDQLIQNHTKLIDAQQKELEKSKQNPVPIGFIYVQLSGQSEPYTLWPQTEWNNVSPKYAGLFFRAEGGKADSFGQTQSEQAKSLQIYNGPCSDNPNGFSEFEFAFNKSSYTVNTIFNEKIFYTGSWSANTENHPYGINFRYNTDKTRPSNQAIRIWIRIK